MEALHGPPRGPPRCRTRVTTFPRSLQTFSQARSWNWQTFARSAQVHPLTRPTTNCPIPCHYLSPPNSSTDSVRTDVREQSLGVGQIVEALAVRAADRRHRRCGPQAYQFIGLGAASLRWGNPGDLRAVLQVVLPSAGYLVGLAVLKNRLPRINRRKAKRQD
jgi:hypothetical protein